MHIHVVIYPEIAVCPRQQCVSPTLTSIYSHMYINKFHHILYIYNQMIYIIIYINNYIYIYINIMDKDCCIHVGITNV